jgi:hypothetical protein
VKLVEVATHWRASWENLYAIERGYELGISEMSDTLLFFSAMMICGFALGVPHLFLASETEVQENVEWPGGRVIQHRHFMYSAVTQRSLAALVAPAGMTFTSMTWPLHSGQVLQLLWTRYRDLADLQYSCWNVQPDEWMCSRCDQCFRLGLGILENGGWPAKIGLDVSRLMEVHGEWRPLVAGNTDLPGPRVSAVLHGQVMASIRAMTTRRLIATTLRNDPRFLLRRSAWTAGRRFAALRAAVPALDPPHIGYRPGFVADLDPLVRARVGAIYRATFPEEPVAEYVAVLERSHRLTDWITEPLVKVAEAALA